MRSTENMAIDGFLLWPCTFCKQDTSDGLKPIIFMAQKAEFFIKDAEASIEVLYDLNDPMTWNQRDWL